MSASPPVTGPRRANLASALAHLNRETLVLLAGMTLGSTATFMVMPLLALYLHVVVRLPTTQIGVLLAVVLVTQQGLPVVAGVAADRWGSRRLLSISIVARVLGCAAFAVGTGLPLLAAAAALVGIGGAASRPTVKALLVDVAGGSRVEAFALRGAAANAGAVVGPLVGGLFFRQFRALFLVVLALYLVYWAMVMLWVPARSPGGTGAVTPARTLRQLVGDPVLVTFTVVSAGFWFLYTQFTFTFPIYAQERFGLAAIVPVLFSVNAVIVILLQYPVLAHLGARIEPWRLLVAGSLVLGASFILLASVGGIAALVLFTIAFSLGELVVVPLQDSITSDLAPASALSGYLGFVSLSGTLGGLLGGPLAGVGYSLAKAHGAYTWFWLANGAIGVLTAAGYLYARSRRTIPPPGGEMARQRRSSSR
jgi:DHA1 family multidrug resistance protein-like MFS transporter